MKTDFYTKTVLTIIALCLTINVVKEFNFFPSAYATENPSETINKTDYRLVPVSDMETIDVRIVDINTYDELNVNVKSIDTYDEMKVNIKNIDTSDELDVNIDEIGGSWVGSGSPIPVTIKQ
ncbi:MAG: hypothetical protein R2781_05305 [Flavobacteriaceae bacterium]